MKFSFGFLAGLAASVMQLTTASPAMSSRDLMVRTPVSVTKLVCDGNTYKCTAALKFGDGRWVAQWSVSVFHKRSRARPSEHELNLMAPVAVKALNCDGDTYLCTANLVWGDGNWVAQWPTAVFHTSTFPYGNSSPNRVGTLAPVKVTRLTCEHDGDIFKCTGALDFGDGRWVARWDTIVFQTLTFEDDSELALVLQ